MHKEALFEFSVIIFYTSQFEMFLSSIQLNHTHVNFYFGIIKKEKVIFNVLPFFILIIYLCWCLLFSFHICLFVCFYFNFFNECIFYVQNKN